jgi:hypothetical protein
MIISGPAALISSSASIAGNTHLPAQSSQSSFISFLERQSHRPSRPQQKAGAKLCYTRLDQALPSISKASSARPSAKTVICTKHITLRGKAPRQTQIPMGMT